MKELLFKYTNIFSFVICFSVYLLLELIWRNKELSYGLVIEGSVYAVIVTGALYVQSLNYKK
jgi:hypothetical protein